MENFRDGNHFAVTRQQFNAMQEITGRPPTRPPADSMSPTRLVSFVRVNYAIGHDFTDVQTCHSLTTRVRVI